MRPGIKKEVTQVANSALDVYQEMATTEKFASTPDVSFTSDGDTDASTNRNICGIISMLESPAVQREKHEVDDHLLATQAIEILKDVVAFVEVRTGAENRSKAVVSKLKQLGAVVVDKLGDEVTHVIWKDGKRNTLQRAKKRNIPVVTVLWVESCMQNETRVSENLFAVQDDRQTGTPIHLPRLKKTKSMQPKDFDEDVASSAERGERIRKRRENKCKIKPSSPSKTSAYFVAETQPLSPFFGSPFSPNLAVPDTPASLRERLNSMKRNMRELQDSESDGPESPIAVQPGMSKDLLVHRKLFDAGSSPMSTPPSSPRPLSTSTQKSPFNYIKCKPIEEERDCDQEPVLSNKSESPRSTRKERSVVVNKSESPRLIKSKKDNGEPSQKGRKNYEDGKAEKRIIAETRKKKLYTTSNRLDHKLIVPTATSTTSGVQKAVKGMANIKVKNRPKNDNSLISELVGLPIQVKMPKRKRGKTSDSESDNEHARKRSKTSSSEEDTEHNRPCKVTRTGKSCENKNTSPKPAVQKKVSSKKPNNFTSVKEKNKSSKEIPMDILLQDFESEYDDSTLYLTSQAGKSKVWATTDINTQPNRLADGRVTRRKSNLLRFDEAKTASTQNIENVAQSTPVTKTRRKTMAVFSPATESVESSKNLVTSPPKTKARRKSIATCSQSVQKDGIDRKSEEVTKSRRKSTTNIKSCQIGLVSDNASDVSGDAVVLRGKRKTRRSSVAVFSTISEDAEVRQSKDDERKESKKSYRSPDRDAKSVTVQETPELLKSKPSNSPVLRTPVKEIHNGSQSLPGTPSTTYTPVNRRRSMRVLAISNSMQKAGTPREYGLQHLHAEEDNVEIAREKDAAIANEVSIDVATNKCPADFDSTGDESLLQRAQRKRKKASNTTVRSNVLSITQRTITESTASSDTGMSHIDGTNNLSSASVFSPVNSRKSIDEFRPEVFNISTKKKLSRAKPSLSDIESSEEEGKREAKLENSRQIKSKNSKSKVADLNKRKGTSDDILSDGRYLKPKTKPTGKKKSSKSSTESTCSSASDSTDAGTKRRRKRSSGSRSSKYPNSVVMTSLHFNEQDAVRSVIKQMGGFHLIDEVDDFTTHVICGDKRRTLNVLYAIARGCWLVSQEWVFNSLETGHWMDEEPFEVHDYFPACQVSRLERATAPGSYQQDLFSGSGLIYVCEETSPPAKHLEALIQLCSGQTTRCQRKADLIVGGLKAANVCVSEQWVLDSITAHRSLPIEQYRLGMNGRLVRSPSPDY